MPNGGAATVMHTITPSRLGNAGPQRVDATIPPKEGGLNVYSDAAIQASEDKLDRRPRKRSGYRAS